MLCSLTAPDSTTKKESFQSAGIEKLTTAATA
jgi:hypothetical protein